jgi:hypothetical protein
MGIGAAPAKVTVASEGAIVPVQQRILGEQLAAQFHQVVEAQLLEPARIRRRDRRGLVQVEHHVVQEKEHRKATRSTPTVLSTTSPCTWLVFGSVPERG